MRSGESLLAAALATAAALRVLAFSTALPFFSHVDEHKHVDVVLKYARGTLPQPEGDAFEAASGQLLGTFGSPEYLLAPGAVAPPPPWRRPAGAMLRKLERDAAFLAARANKETYQAPVYYAVAGLWLRLGDAAGLEGARLLYWLRGLNALALGLLVWLAHRGLARLFPGAALEDSLPRLGVPVLLAVFPQDAFYTVTRDALSPLVAGAAFLLALRVARHPEGGARLYAAAGLTAALAFLTKLTNAALLGPLVLASARSRRAGWRLAWLWIPALAPVALWLTRNQWLFGDPTATGLKAARLGWEPNPPQHWLEHPLFGATGIGHFVTGLIPSFWRGEGVWHSTLLAWPPADALYTGSSLVLVGLAALGLALGRSRPPARLAGGAALLMLGLCVAELAGLSLLYRFPADGNPSAARPWFDQGRLIAGALLPFLILYTQGLALAASRLPARLGGLVAWGAIGLVAGVALGSEIALSLPIFASEYNLYHLP